MLSEYLEPEVRSEGRLREVVTNHLCLPPPQEYEERLARLKADYEAEQESRVRLQEDITAMRNSYDVKLSTLEENLRKEKETGVCCRAPPPLSFLLVTPLSIQPGGYHSYPRLEVRKQAQRREVYCFWPPSWGNGVRTGVQALWAQS